ncbi:MAG: ribosomal RNA small subunit methyltransferase A, partial [Deltaproteobacteria bacterium]
MDLRPRELLREARRRGLLPKKALGQHFLVEEGIAERIVELSQVDQRDVILEIGPGIGALTFVLLERSRKVVAVEIDPRFIPFLREMAGDDDRLELLEGDIMEVDLGGIALREGRLKVVSNLPYNLSVPILFRLLEEREHLKGMTLMVQREVAERITSPPGRKSYGALSVLCQLWADPKVVMYVPPGAFWPPPEVEGAV